MSCVLRLSAPEIEIRVAAMKVSPYRVDRGTAHFQVSQCDFDDMPGQIDDALKFLELNANGLKPLLAAGVRGSMDFAVRLPIDRFATRSFPAALVSAAGAVGLGLDLSAYPEDGEHAV